MSFSAMLAKKYIFAHKRHSVLTVFGIAAAVALITVLFTIGSSYLETMLGYELGRDPWHAEVWNLSKEQAEAFVGTGEFEDCEFGEESYEIPSWDGTFETITDSYLRVRFKPDTEDCDESMEIGAKAAGYSYRVPNSPYKYILNEELLRLENIGAEAKGQNIQRFAIFYVFILFVIFCSRLVIDTAFEISSKEREKQFGVLQSIGATKKQIAAVMTWEGGFLSLIGIPLGILFGLGASYLLYSGILASGGLDMFSEHGKDMKLIFSVSPLFLLVVAATGLMWVLFSAFGTGMRAAKMSPIEAIRSRGAAVKKVKRRSLFGLIFGWTGRLASRNIRRGKKRFVITVMSVTLSMVLFVGFFYAIDIMVAFTEEEFNSSGYDFAIQEKIKYTDEDGDGKAEHISNKIPYREFGALLYESGYFENIVCAPITDIRAYIKDLPLSDELAEINRRSEKTWMRIQFVDEALYKRIMGDDPLVPYSQLAEENGYVLLNAVEVREFYYNYGDGEEEYIHALNISRGETIPVHKSYYVPLDEPILIEHGAGGEYGGYVEAVREEEKTAELELKILDILEEPSDIFDSYADSIHLIGTYDQYDKVFFQYDVDWEIKTLADVTRNMVITADLKDGESYDKAMAFLENHDLETWEDSYAERIAEESFVAMVKMIGYTLLGLITLIAVINMVNVVSTGIINRRPEIASMRSLGMSRGQLRRMILIECLQYAVVSGIAAIILSEVLLHLTVGSMNLFELPEELAWVIDYYKPIGYVLVAMAAAFVCAAAAAIMPLREIGKDSLLPREV